VHLLLRWWLFCLLQLRNVRMGASSVQDVVIIVMTIAIAVTATQHLDACQRTLAWEIVMVATMLNGALM
jgi:hypothetical protein